MSYLLRIDASVSGEASVSRQVADTFERFWTGDVVRRDLGRSPVEHLGRDGISARTTAPERHTPEQAVAAARQEELVAEFLGASAYLFAVPMYNYTLPSVFKAWLDQIMIVGRTIGLGLNAAPSAGRPVTIVSARGGGYGPGAPQHGKDFLVPTLTAILGDPALMALEVRAITPELTYAKVMEPLRALLPQHEASLAESHRLARELSTRSA